MIKQLFGKALDIGKNVVIPAISVAALCLFSPVFAHASESVTEKFVDVEEGKWYVSEVQWVYDNGVMGGYSDGSNRFGIGDTLTRAQLATLIANHAGADTESRIDATGISDLAEGGKWYTGACNWAVENGIVTGYTDANGNVTAFGPDDSVTREQAMVILARYAQKNGTDISTSNDVLTLFPDCSKVASWAKNSVAWIVREGVVSGAYHDKDYYIDPKRDVLREEIAKMIHVTIEEINGTNTAEGMKGWVKDNGSWYWFSDKGTMAKGTWVDNYYINSKGVMKNNAVFQIKNAETGKYLDLANDSKKSGASLNVSNASGNNSSKWKITSTTDYAVLCGGTNSNLALNDGTSSGNSLTANTKKNGSGTQKWIIERAGSGTYRFKSLSTGLYLTAVNGKAVLTELDTSNNAQCWKTPVSSLVYDGFQNPSQYYQVSNESVTIKNQGKNKFGFRQESRIGIDATREECIETMIDVAYEYLDANTPYIWDYACAPGVGVDCAGLVLQCLYATGMDLTTHEYYMNPWDHYYTPGHDHYAVWMRQTEGFKHVALEDRQRGDLIFYEGHVAIYLGNDKIIDAYPSKVRITSIWTHSYPIAVARPFVD